MKYELTNARAKRVAVMNYLLTIDHKFHEGWRTVGSITSHTGVSARDMRALSNLYPQTFLGGNKGYKLVAMATTFEINNAVRTLLSRSESVMHRARALQRYSLERQKADSVRPYRAVA